MLTNDDTLNEALTMSLLIILANGMRQGVKVKTMRKLGVAKGKEMQKEKSK